MKLPHLLAIIAISLVVAFVALSPNTSAKFRPGSMAAPVAVDDTFTVHGGIQLPSLLANDFDPDGDGINFFAYGSQPQHGFLVGSSGHPPISYTANPGYTGPDSFTYRIRDDLGALSGFATVTLNVVNGAPVAVDDAFLVRGGGLTIPNLLANDSDPDSDGISFGGYGSQPQHGSLVGSSGHPPTSYSPSLGYTGTDSFTYRVCDSLGACSSYATVTFHVIGDGENLGNGDEGTGGCEFVGEPINVTNGNMFLEQTDYALPGAGPAIDVTRTYNSQSAFIGLFGKGWSTAYDESLTIYDSGLVRLNEPDGRATYFGRAAGSSGAFAPVEADFHGQLTQTGGGFSLSMKDGSVHQFNSTGRLMSLTDRNANQTTLAYDLSGKLNSVADPFGRHLFFIIINGRVTSLADLTGVVANYTYGTSNELLSVTYADNSQFVFSYDANLRLTTVKDALNNVLESHTYDTQGRALTSAKHGGVELYTLNYVSATETHVTDALSRVTEYTFDITKGRNLVTRIEGNCSCGSSQVQTWTYDNQLNITAETDALNHTRTFTYDTNGNRLTETDATGTVTYTYNSFGQVLTRTDQMGGVTTNTYNSQGNLLTAKNALNDTTTFTYDSRGQLLTVTDARSKVTTFTWDTSGRLSQHKDALNNTTNFGYDLRARLTSETNALSQVTNYEYDAAGRLKKIIYPDTNFVLITYDLGGRRTKVKDPRGNETTFTYDSAYRLTSVTDAATHTTSYGYDLMSNRTSMTDALARVTDYEYDDFNRLKKVIYPPAFTGSTRQQETIEYDAAGNVAKRTDTAGRDTTYLYDAVNRLTKVTDPALQATQFEYNARSHTTKVIDALNQHYVFVYDALGRVTQSTRAGVSMSYVYDAVGNRTQRTDYNGAVTNYTFDDLNRLTNISYPDSTSASYGYDVLSRLTSATNPNGTVTFVYDSRDRITSTTDVWGQTLGYSYDGNGNRTALTVGGSGYSTYQYDVIDRLTNLADSASQNFVYSYDIVNRLTSRTAPSGVTTSFTYDGLDRLFELAHTKSPATLSINQYGYDSANRIFSWLGSSGNRSFSYDASDRLTTMTKMGGNESYGYDAVGNRTTSHLSASYTHQPFNRLTSTTSATYTYDNNGNLLTKVDGSGTRTYTWDSDNRLKQVTLPGGATVNYKYDALGRRIQRTTSTGADERYVHDGHDVLLDLNSSLAVTTSYLNGLGIDDHLRQTNTTTGVSYFLTDHLSSTSGLTDASGNVIETLSYDSFGNNPGSTRTRYTYTGRERDADTGLLHYRARWYDPAQGRFISEDPIGFEGGMNWYAYVDNSPLSASDPFGLAKCKDPKYCAQLLKRIADKTNGFWNNFRPYKDSGFVDKGKPWKHGGKTGVSGAGNHYTSLIQRQNGLIKDINDYIANCMDDDDDWPEGLKEGSEAAKQHVPWPVNIPTREELRLQVESHRQMEQFWKKVLIGDLAVGAILLRPPVPVPLIPRIFAPILGW
jgi:RHS repeat-associated protein